MSAVQAEALIVRILRWLRGDVRDVVQVVARQRPNDGARASGVDLDLGLDRWSHQLTRQRAVAVARRWLLIALGIALVPAIIVLASGGSRPYWVVAVLLLALISGVVVLTRRVSSAQTARLLDRALGLHEQLGTALELQSESAATVGLAAMVLEDATLAVRQSLSSARAVGHRAGIEWAWVAVVALALAVVIAVPRHGSDSVGHAVHLHGGAAAASGSGTSSDRQKAATHPATTAAQSATSPATLPPVHGVGASRWAGAGINPNQHAQVQAKSQGGAAAASQKKSGLSVASTGAVPSQAKLAGLSATGRNAPGAAGKTGSSAQPAKSGAGASPSTAAAKPSQGTGKTPRGAKGTPGGGTAGNQRAAVSHRTGVVPELGTSSKELPLQAGYTPGAGRVAAQEGQSQSSSGGGGNGGRSGQAGASSGQGGANFSVIPTTSNAPSASNQDLLQTFFGTTDQLSFKGW